MGSYTVESRRWLTSVNDVSPDVWFAIDDDHRVAVLRVHGVRRSATAERQLEAMCVTATGADRDRRPHAPSYRAPSRAPIIERAELATHDDVKWAEAGAYVYVAATPSGPYVRVVSPRRPLGADLLPRLVRGRRLPIVFADAAEVVQLEGAARRSALPSEDLERRGKNLGGFRPAPSRPPPTETTRTEQVMDTTRNVLFLVLGLVALYAAIAHP